MTPYAVVACIVAVFLSEIGVKNVAGTVLLAMVWPVLIPVTCYFTLKAKVLKAPFRDDWVLSVELLGCVCVTAAGSYLYLQQRMP